MPTGAAWSAYGDTARGELICSSALSCSNTHNASAPLGGIAYIIACNYAAVKNNLSNSHTHTMRGKTH